MGNPCDEHDLNFFYACTTITIGNGAKAPFWYSPWLFGRKPKDIAPLVHDASTRKNWKVREALRNNAWILKINPPTVVTVDPIREFFTLWMFVNDFHLDDLAEDNITWKHTTNGIYSTASAYKAQFLGKTLSPMDYMIWKIWAPPKVKLFVWLAIQDRIWIADRLARRGWPNCGLCPLCKRVQESGTHILFKCRFTLRLWGLVKDWLHLENIDPASWHLERYVEEWWTNRADSSTLSGG